MDTERHLEELARLQRALSRTLEEPMNSYARSIVRPTLVKELGQAVEEAREAGLVERDIDGLVAELELETGMSPVELENFWDPCRLSKSWRKGR